MQSEAMLTPREISPLPEKFSLEKNQTHDIVSHRTESPTHYQQTNPAPSTPPGVVKGKACAMKRAELQQKGDEGGGGGWDGEQVGVLR